MAKRNKACPICFLKNAFKPKYALVDIDTDEVFNNGVLETPPMGWSSWNCFRNKISEEMILDVAKAYKKSGLIEAGYKYFNLDDDWHSNLRDENGELQGDLSKFPRNVAPLVKDLNDMGLKVGIYSSNGTLTCEDLPASEGNEDRDAYTFAKWGIEYFKYDFCHNVPLSKYAPLISVMSLAKLGETEKYSYSVDTAHLEGSARIFKDEKMPNGVFVSGLDANKGAITFENVNVEEAGKYALTLTVKKHGWTYDKYAMIIVNGKKKYEVSTPGCKPWNDYTRCQVVVELEKGVNTIKIFNPIAKKEDSARILYKRMSDALIRQSERYAKETGSEVKPIAFSICEWGFNKPYEWGRFTGNLWRTTQDIRPWMWWINVIYRHNVKLYKYAGVGTYNDPDMLEVGNGDLTPTQGRSHFSLWCMMASPLILGNDLRKFILPNGEVDESNETLKIITNKNLIAIDQDKLCKPAKPIKLGGVDILARPLEGGRVALCLYNKTKMKKTAKFDVRKLINDEYVCLEDAKNYDIVEQWTGETEEDKISVKLEAFASKVYVITPKK